MNIKNFISDSPEFKAMSTRINKDINSMRNNAITFLKKEGAWPENQKE